MSDATRGLTPVKRALFALEEMQAKLDRIERGNSEPIAVIGMACRLPAGADTPERLWEILRDGVDAVTEVPADRWDAEAFYDPSLDAPGKMYSKAGAFLENKVDLFDAGFFGISPREAAAMDPQQRLLLEVAWETLERAGYASEASRPPQTGIFAGISTYDYAQLLARHGAYSDIGTYSGTGTLLSVVAGRISYLLGVHGPTLALDTACSSSLVAVHLACQSLRLRETDLALAGGVNLMLSPATTIAIARMHALAVRGRCRSFDASADGYIRGEGCAVIALKRLSDALRDRDQILALIRGSAVNHDGRSGGFTAPSGSAQEAVIREALANARVPPEQVSCVEAHGTGTPLGDPIEANALRAVLAANRQRPFFLGSAKTNFGHLEAAAGALALLKVILSLQHGQVPKHLHWTDPSPYIDWDTLPAVIPSRTQPWDANGTPRIAGVSSFGISGTNAHVVLEEAPPRPDAPADESDRPRHLIALSAASETALAQLADRFAKHLAVTSDSLADICYSTNVGRPHHPQRLAVDGRTREELADGLTSYASDARGAQDAKLAFLFTGQGSQYSGMASDLYATHPRFRETIDRCAEIWNRRLAAPLRSVIFESAGAALLDQTQYTQPALFAIEFALAELWKSWGVEPQAVIGHSVGEYVAAAVAGVLSPEDALELLIERARLMQQLPEGGIMAAVAASESAVAAEIEPYGDQVSIAAINSPHETVISGEISAMRRVAAALEQAGLGHRPLRTSHAFHSRLIEPMLAALAEAASRVRCQPPTLELVSNVTGDFADATLLADPRYWTKHARQTVRFSDGMRALAANGFNLFLELGPTTTLAALGRRTIEAASNCWLTSLQKGKNDWAQILHSLGRLYTAGLSIDWAAFDAPFARRRVTLPTYPFERSRHWFALSRRGDDSTPESRLGRRLRSPALDAAVYERQLRIEADPLLDGHRIRGASVVPAAAYVEMASLAAAELFGEPHGAIADLTIEEALIVPEEGSVTLQVIVAPRAPHEFQIVSRPAAETEGGEWRTHARGRLERGEPALARQATPPPLAEQIQAPSGREIPIEDFYEGFASRGMDYGGPFRSVARLWTRDAGAFARIEIADDATTPPHTLHPAMVDGCFQIFGTLLAPELDSSESVYLPVRIERAEWLGAFPDAIWCHLARRADGEPSGQVVGDLALADSAGKLLARIEGLALKEVRVPASARASDPQDLLYRVQWEQRSAGTQGHAADSGAWLIAGGSQSLCRELSDRLTGAGQHVEFADTAPTRIAEAAASKPWQGVIVVIEGNPQTYSRACAAALEAVQALAGRTLASGLWFVTRGAQWVEDSGNEEALGAAGVWGLARVASLEHPELNCVCVDLDPAAPAGEAASLFEELMASAREEQVVFRGGRRLVPRLVRLPKTPEPAKDRALQLQIRSRGALNQLALTSVPRPEPGPEQVELRVRATGLNFRDVLNALGMYPGEAGALGLECSGTIVRVGAGVAEFRVGDDVIAFTQGSFSDYVVCDARYAVQKGSLSFEQAATISIAFLTAYHALHNLARIAPGDRVLIHAAAGGVGMAAAQLALQAGAEVFGTAGTEEKRSRLKSMGVQHVMNSRTLDFADEVMTLTGGRGVDIALNSLVGEYITRTMAILSPNGRFVEIGKIELWDQAKVAAFRGDISYSSFDIGEVAKGDPGRVQSMFHAIVSGLADGSLQPLPFTAFPIEEAERAFRFMAQSKHMGKVVVVQKPPARETFKIDGKGTYLVTGGLGGLGRHIAGWLIDEGARQLVLVGRKGATDPDAAKAVAELERRGAKVAVRAVDVAQPADVHTLFDDIDRTMAPLCGVIHAAGILRDDPLREQTAKHFAAVSGPKVDGTWNLHQETRDRPLDFFVTFSSVAAILGSPGQANYAAANAFMDAMAHFRRSRGLPALSINWGPWAEAGMASEAASSAQSRWRRQGVELLSPGAGLQTLRRALHLADESQLVAIRADWAKLLRQFPAGTEPPFLSRLAPRATTSRPAARQAVREIVRRIRAASVDDRYELVADFIRGEVAKVLGFVGSDGVAVHTPLRDLGFDSLMAIELSNSITSLIGHRLSPATLLETPTIHDLAGAVVGELAARG